MDSDTEAETNRVDAGITDGTSRSADGDDGDGDDGDDRETAGGDATRIDPSAVDRTAAARGGVYALLATLFDEPSASLHERLAAGEVDATCRRLVAASGLAVEPPDLTVDDDHETLCARFNSLFTVGYAEYEDRTDGSLDSEGPPVSLYETAYRPEASWNDVNLDLARAYDYFGLEIDRSVRDNHDYLPYLLEFAGYLARREADVGSGANDAERATADTADTAESATDAARARLDFHDRHLHVVAGGVAERVDEEPGTGLYGELAAFLDRFVTADQRALAERFEGSVGTGAGGGGSGTGGAGDDAAGPARGGDGG